MQKRLTCGLWVPAGVDLERWVHAEAAVAEESGWRVVSLVREWDDLAVLMADGIVEIGIIPSRDHLPRDRLPRLVAVDEHRPPAPLQRRPAIRWSRGQ